MQPKVQRGGECRVWVSRGEAERGKRKTRERGIGGAAVPRLRFTGGQLRSASYCQPQRGDRSTAQGNALGTVYAPRFQAL